MQFIKRVMVLFGLQRAAGWINSIDQRINLFITGMARERLQYGMVVLIGLILFLRIVRG